MFDARAPGRLAVVALLFTALLFSLSFIVVKAIELTPASLAVWRTGLGALFLAGVGLVTRSGTLASWAPLAVAGTAYGFEQLVLIEAIQTTSVANVSTIGALLPLVVAFVSPRIVGEAVPLPVKLWAAFAALGVGLVLWTGSRHPAASVRGNLLAAASLALFLVFFLGCKRARADGTSSLTVTAVVLGIAFFVTLPFALGSNAALAPSGLEQWLLVVLLVLGPGNGLFILNWAHSHVSATPAAICLNLVPAFASLWAFVAFDEACGAGQIVGTLVVWAAVSAVARRSGTTTRG